MMLRTKACVGVLLLLILVGFYSNSVSIVYRTLTPFISRRFDLEMYPVLTLTSYRHLFALYLFQRRYRPQVEEGPGHPPPPKKHLPPSFDLLVLLPSSSSYQPLCGKRTAQLSKGGSHGDGLCRYVGGGGVTGWGL